MANDTNDLWEQAEAAGIDLKPFRDIYSTAPKSAINALREAMKTLAKPQTNTRTDYVALFKEKYGKLLASFDKAHDAVQRAIDTFSDEHGVYLYLDPDSEDLIRLGRAPRGSRKGTGRDLKEFAEEARAKGYKLDLRVSGAVADPYQYATLQLDGMVKLPDNTVVSDLKNWTTPVYQDAVRRGVRNTVVGSPWKGVQMQNLRGDWITIDKVYKEVMNG